ncbi:MAG TPA: HAMP domain-containing sensor histidine kinase [Actinotalea sp.]|jgi:signal transduction histidine kinase
MGFGWRLGVSVALVVVAGAVTLLVTALLIAPSAFHAHLEAALPGAVEPAVQTQVDEAFANAVLVALGIAVPVALLTAFAVTWVVANRLTRSLATLAEAAEAIAGGESAGRLQAPAIGAEFAQLAAALNTMADRLAATESTRRRLIGDLAHELRTPLASLEATVDAVADGVLPADPTTMATLREQAERLRHLVTDMAAVSRAEERQLALAPRHLDLSTAARQSVAAHHAPFTRAGRDLDLDAPDPGPVVLADGQRLAEVLDNLLDNALRHAPEGGRVRVVVRADGDDAVLEVVDDGEGFTPEDGRRIFERFFRADTSRPGRGSHSGVGLTIARAIVDAHGGTLTAQSAGPGTGSTFTVRLPAAEVRPPGSASRSSRG